MKRQNVKEQILGLVDSRGTVASRDLAAATGLTRQAIHGHLASLVQDRVLVAEGRGRGVRYRRPGSARSWSFRRAGLAEDRVWQQVSAEEPTVRASPELESTLDYALTELVNNAIEHSQGERVDVRVAIAGPTLVLEVVDDGVGVFEHLRRRLGLESQLHAIQELSKGKTTTDPAHHTGEGIFFVSKLATLFVMESLRTRWTVDNVRHDQAVGSGSHDQGTLVRFEIERDTRRRPKDVFDAYTEDFAFARTRIVVKLFEIGVRFVSRSEARRLLQGLDRFHEVILDFRGVEEVGQGFADEVFRVWAGAHPQTRLVPEAMTPTVEFMVRRARP
jgi:hypothetical protein